MRGYELNEKLSSQQVGEHQGSLGSSHAFLRVQPDTVIVTALKKSEDDKELILRFYEWAGEEDDIELKLAESVRSAEETNLMEQPIEPVPIESGSNILIHTKPYEIKTVKLKLANK